VLGKVAREHAVLVIRVGLGGEGVFQLVVVDVPGVNQLPVAVQVAAVGEAPAVEAVDTGVDAAHQQGRVLEAGLIGRRARRRRCPSRSAWCHLREEECFCPWSGELGPASWPSPARCSSA